MTETRKFDEQTGWDHDPGGPRLGGAGWAPPGADYFIDRADPYWGHVLDKARAAYGDPNMHYSTDDVGQQRRLVFGDDTPVPVDGSLAYRDAANHRTYLLNNDGTVSPLGANGTVGQPIPPAGFRRTADGAYAPVDSADHQVAPLTTGLPPTPHGFHDADGVLTPQNARGDYYVDDPATGKRAYFDKDGKPVSAAQFDDASRAPPVAPGMPTDEQQSGRAADAVRKLHEELAGRYSQISDAETKLSEVLLSAHATTDDGQQKLQGIQQKIVEAVNNPMLSLDTPVGEQAFLKFLRGHVAAIGDIVKSGSLTAEDRSKAVEALSNLYAADPASPAATPAADPPAAASPPEGAPIDAGLGPEEPTPDPTLSDLGTPSMGATPAADPLSSLASTLPAAMGAFPTGGLGAGWGGDPFSSLAGAAAPLAGLASQLGDQARRGDPADHSASDTSAGESRKADYGNVAKDQQPQSDNASTPPAAPEPHGSPGEGAPPAAPAVSPVAATTVSLPDGSTATARTAALAEAVKSYLGGTPVDAAYREAGIELPPPGTRVTDPVDPSALSCGAIGMFRDHYVVALSPVKALADGQVVPLSSVASGPDFLGWMDPAATTAPRGSPAVAPTG
jgi:hypothetical protein